MGKPLEPIDGQKAPVKINIGKEFMKAGGQGLINEMRRNFISKAAKKSSQSINRNRAAIKDEIKKVH